MHPETFPKLNVLFQHHETISITNSPQEKMRTIGQRYRRAFEIFGEGGESDGESTNKDGTEDNIYLKRTRRSVCEKEKFTERIIQRKKCILNVHL